jgi:predicted RNA-binding protein YlxR (DUF448 family)
MATVEIDELTYKCPTCRGLGQIPNKPGDDPWRGGYVCPSCQHEVEAGKRRVDVAEIMKRLVDLEKIVEEQANEIKELRREVDHPKGCGCFGCTG